jgi:hypothetical protein
MQDVACIMFDYGVGIFYLVLSKAHVIDKLRNLTKSPWSKCLSTFNSKQWFTNVSKPTIIALHFYKTIADNNIKFKSYFYWITMYLITIFQS